MVTVHPDTRPHTGKSVHPLGALLEAHGVADKVVMTIYTLVIIIWTILYKQKLSSELRSFLEACLTPVPTQR